MPTTPEPCESLEQRLMLAGQQEQATLLLAADQPAAPANDTSLAPHSASEDQTPQPTRQEIYPLAPLHEYFASPDNGAIRSDGSAGDGVVIQSVPGASIDQAANAPIGVAQGIYPGRVAWVRDADATSGDSDPTTGKFTAPAGEYYWDETHTNQAVVSQMMGTVLRWLTKQTTDAGAWDALFRYFNKSKGYGDIGYTPGEKIVIKANLNGSNSLTAGMSNGIDPTPAVVYALLDQLVNVAGVAQQDIAIYDSLKVWADKYYLKLSANFPQVRYVDKLGASGRELVRASPDGQVYWSDGQPPDKLPTCVTEAKYMINMSIAKKHREAGISVSGKNHYGSLCRVPSPVTAPTADIHKTRPRDCQGMGQYRQLTDLMGHEQLGGKTMLYLVDAIWGGWDYSGSNSIPTTWVTLGNDWLSSLFASQDPVAIDSVVHDFLVAEEKAWMALGKPARGFSGYGPIYTNSDDYLHEAALAGTPGGRQYDPNGDGVYLTSLGVHEHWNNPVDRQYTRNLRTGLGIELVRSDEEAFAPDVAITSPADGAYVAPGSLLTLAASAKDIDGRVTRVDFYANGILLGSDTNSADGWSYDWAPVPAGLHVLTAWAYDNGGRISISPAATLISGPVVWVEATQPEAGESGPQTGQWTIHRMGPTSGALTVNFTMGGSADGSDYILPGTSVVIPDGQDRVHVAMTPIDDGQAEGDETAILQLSAGAYSIGTTSSATVTIADNDASGVPAAGLLGWWRLDEAAGSTTAADSSGNGHTLTAAGNTTFAAGQFGNGAKFDGSGDYLRDASAGAYLNGLSAFTVTSWIKPGAIDNRGWITTRAPGADDADCGIALRWVASEGSRANFIRAIISTAAGSTYVDSPVNINDTHHWIFVALTWDAAGDGRLRLYINSTQPVTPSFDAGPLTGTVINNANELRIGQGTRSTSGDFSGLVDEVRIYSRALTGAQIGQVMNAAPWFLRVSQGTPTTATLVWADPGDHEAGYRIERSIDGATFVQVGTAGRGQTTWIDTGLTAGTLYYYRIRAWNYSGSASSPVLESPWSNIATSPLGQIRGQVWNDANANGVRDAGEAGLDGAKVYLDANADGVFDAVTEFSTSVNPDGSYVFRGLPAGTYTVRLVVPPAMAALAAAAGPYTVVLGESDNATGNDFAARAASVISVTGGTVALSGNEYARSIAINGDGRLDVGVGSLVVRNGDLAQISAWLASGQNTGGTPWTGPGIMSSVAAADVSGLHAVGIIRNSADGVTPIYSAFGGYVAGAGDVLVRYTLYGDATLDGVVNFNDLLVLAQNYNTAGGTWGGGDFDYDGHVNFADLLKLAQNYNQALPSPAAAMAPEESPAAPPATWDLLGTWEKIKPAAGPTTADLLLADASGLL